MPVKKVSSDEVEVSQRIAQLDVLGRRNGEPPEASSRKSRELGVNPDQPFGAGIRQGPEHDGVDNGEDCGGCADA